MALRFEEGWKRLEVGKWKTTEDQEMAAYAAIW